jgi:hypothetical protein
MKSHSKIFSAGARIDILAPDEVRLYQVLDARERGPTFDRRRSNSRDTNRHNAGRRNAPSGSKRRTKP